MAVTDSARQLIEAATAEFEQPSGLHAALYKLLQAQEQILSRPAPDLETLLLLREALARLRSAEHRMTRGGLDTLQAAIDKLDLALARQGGLTGTLPAAGASPGGPTSAPSQPWPPEAAALPGSPPGEPPAEEPWRTVRMTPLPPAAESPAQALARVRGERLRAIHDIGTRLAAREYEPRARCAIVAQYIRRAIAVERLTVAIYDPQGSLLHFIFAVGTAEDLLPPSIPLGDDSLSYTLRTRRPLRLIAPHSELHTPLLADEQQVLGVISIHTQPRDAYDEEDEQFMAIIASLLAGAWSRAQIARQSERRIEELHTLHEATVAMTSALSLEQVLYTVGQHLMQALGVQGARILRCTSEVPGPASPGADALGPRLEVLLDLANTPSLRCLTPGTQFERGTLATADTVVDTAEPAVAWASHSQLAPSERAQLTAEGVRAQLVVPLIVRGAVLGVVALRESRWERSFPTGDLRLAQMLANQAAVAIENARIYRQATQLVTELTALRETALDLASQLDFKQVLERVIERASHLLGARGGTLYLLEPAPLENGAAPEGAVLYVAISRVPWADYIGRRVRLGEGLAGRVAQSRQPMIVHDYSHWPGRAEQFADEPIQAAISVPLRWGNMVLGALNILDDRPERTFSHEDLDLLTQFAPQACLSIRNAQLYQALQRHVVELEQAQARLVQSEKLAAVGRLGASIAHEVNNPLQSIQNCLHLCLHRSLSEEKRFEYLSLAQQEVERLVEIVQRMIDFYRPSREGRTPAQINALLHDVLTLANKQLEHAHVQVQRTFDPELPPVEVVPNHLKQVFLNLVLNAMEAMPQGGALHVRTRRAGEQWLAVDFSDEGGGIAASELEKIFEPFYTSKARGTGLGLAVSYGIIQAHAGQIDVHSAVGRGTTFTVRLPLKGAEALPASQPWKQELERGEPG